MAKYRLKLTNQTNRQLEALYVEGVRSWGEARADQYYTDLLRHLDRLLDNPLLYMAVDHIRPGYRRSVCGAHAVYYRIVGDAVEIVGIVKHQNPDTAV